MQIYGGFCDFFNKNRKLEIMKKSTNRKRKKEKIDLKE